MRLFMAIKAFFRILFSGEYAEQVRALDSSPAQLTAETAAPADDRPTTADLDKARADAVKAPAVLLSLLQREGRLLDFIEEDIDGFADAQIGAAVRTVHSGCRKVFREYVTLEAIEEGAEGAKVEVPEGFDPSAIRLTGAVKGDPPFNGTLHHHGWRIAEMTLPTRPESHAADVVAPAEIQVD